MVKKNNKEQCCNYLMPDGKLIKLRVGFHVNRLLPNLNSSPAKTYEFRLNPPSMTECNAIFPR